MNSERPAPGSYEDASLQTLLNGARLTFAERLDWLESMVDLARRWHGQAHLDRQWLREAPGGSWEQADRLLRVAETTPPYSTQGSASTPPDDGQPPHTP